MGSPFQLESIFRVLQRKDGFLTDAFLDSLLLHELGDEVSGQKIKDFLIKSHAVSMIFRETGQAEKDLEIWYIPNLATEEGIINTIIAVLQKELLELIPGYRNRTGHGINVYYLKRDFGVYLSRAGAYEIEKRQIRRGVMIASLHDALHVRKEEAGGIIMQYFNDETRGRYNIISGDLFRNRQSIIRGANEILMRMNRLPVQSDEKEWSPTKPENNADREWIEVYRRLSRNPATRAIRDTMSQAIEQFIVVNETIDEPRFRDYLKDLADIYMNTFEIEKLKDDHYKLRIVKVIQYIYANGLEICRAIKSGITGMPVDEELVDAFIYWVVEISLKIHQEFLNSLIKKYNVFYYLYIRSYFAHRGMKESPSVLSYFMILRNLFCIKQSDSRLVRGVLARNPSIIP